MSPSRCSQCDFIVLDDAAPEDGCCPGCGAIWQVAVLSALAPSTLPQTDTTDAAHSARGPRRTSRFVPFLMGLFVGLLLVAGGVAFWGREIYQQSKQAIADRDQLSSTVDTLKLGAVEAITRRADAERLMREAERKLANAEAQTAMVRNEVDQLQGELARLTETQGETQSIIDELEASLASARRSERHSYVRSWQILGPLPLEETGEWVDNLSSKNLATSKSFLVPKSLQEEMGKTIRWRAYESDENQIHLSKAFATGAKVSCYLTTYIFADDTTKLQLSLGCDDGMAVWVNREKVHERRGQGAASPGQDKVVVTFKQGWNEVLVHVDNSGGADWALFFECRSEDGQRPFPVYATTLAPRRKLDPDSAPK